MDNNKLNVLNQIGYKVKKTCAFCTHGVFVNGSMFGTCSKHEYEHLKHKSVRKLSIHKCGVCGNFKGNEAELDKLEGFKQLVETK